MAGDIESVLTIRRPFERVLREGYKYDDKCLRNEFGVLINYLATSPLSHQFFLDKDDPSGISFLEFMIRCVTQDELATSGQKKPLLTIKDEDVELKKLLLTGILYICREKSNTEAHQVLIDTNFF